MKALISSHSNSLASSSVVVHTHVLNGLIAYSLALMNHLLFQTNVALCRQHAGFQTVSSDPVTEVPTTQDTFYRVPKKPSILRERWLEAIGRTEDTIVNQVHGHLSHDMILVLI